MATVRELVTRLGFKTDMSGAKKYDQALKTIGKGALVVAGAVAGAGAAMVKLASDAGNAAANISDGARAAGLSAKSYQELGYAIAGMAGISEKEAGSSLEKLKSRIDLAAAGSKNMQGVFKGLGFSMKEITAGLDTEEVFNRINSSMQDSTKRAGAVEAASKLLGRTTSRKLIPAMRQNGREISLLRERYRELGLAMSAEELSKAAGLPDMLNDLSKVMTRIKEQVGIALIPAVTRLAEAFLSWYIANKDLIDQGIETTIEKVTNIASTLYDIIVKIKDKLDPLVEAFGGWGVAIEAVILAWAGFKIGSLVASIISIGTALIPVIAATWAWTAALLANPVTWVVAGIVALIAAIVLAVKHWDKIKEAGKKATEALGNAVTWAKDKALAAWQAIKDGFKKAFDWIQSKIEAFKEILVGIFTFDRDKILAGFEALAGPLIKWFLGLGTRLTSALMEKLPAPLANALKGIGGKINAVVAPQANIARSVTSSDVNKNTNITATTNATIQVPPGTPQDQQRAIQKQVEETVGKVFDQQIGGAIRDYGYEG